MWITERWKLAFFLFKGAKNTLKSRQGENETDDKANYKNAVTVFQQKHDSDSSDDGYIDVDAIEHRIDVDKHYVNVEMYANCLV